MKIETGIKSPESGKYPRCEDMNIGDSFVIKRERNDDRVKACNTMRSKSDNKNLGHLYKSSKVEGGYRIWRVK